jgi:histidine ammonia-lyase
MDLIMDVHHISPLKLSLADINRIVNEDYRLELSDEAKGLIIKCREYLDRKMASSAEPIYGINTGFGALYNVKIEDSQLSLLQKNLVMSHACGMGAEVPQHIVKLMLLLKVQSLAYGNSGVQLVTVQRLVDFYNNDVLPVVHEQGSLGASGDLAPLAHLSLPLLGLGEVNYKGERMLSAEVLSLLKWEPIELQSKEGLALLNGTQFMSAYGVACLLKSERLSHWADVIAAMSLDAYDGRPEPFLDATHLVRAHKGQLQTARNIRAILEGSQLLAQPKKNVQDPYSFRCIPQVHGASKDAIEYAENVFTIEVNSVTDNPTLFPDEDLIISAGNFHGQPLALALDHLAIAVAELGSISERRTYQLIAGLRGLPPFLVSKPGLNSGFMIPQYSAASIASQNKQLATPASVDSIVSSNGQEDHVSMGANAAVKALKVVNNLESILAIELCNAAQAMEFRRPLQSSSTIEKLHTEYRKAVAFVEEDRLMYPNLHSSIEFIREYAL